jgi:hypothetical protein
MDAATAAAADEEEVQLARMADKLQNRDAYAVLSSLPWPSTFFLGRR